MNRCGEEREELRQDWCLGTAREEKSNSEKKWSICFQSFFNALKWLTLWYRCYCAMNIVKMAPSTSHLITTVTSPLHVDTSLNCSSVNSDLHYNVTNTRCFCDVDYGVVRLQCQTGYVDVMDEASSGPAYGRTCISLESLIFTSSCVLTFT